MENVLALLWPPTVWHWVVLGLLLLAVEMAIGTFDLLWIGVAALATALVFSGVVPVPEEFSGLPSQAGVFALLAVALVGLGRTVFAGLRKPAAGNPTLNQPGARMVGQRGTVSEAFRGGRGRASIGDTSWLAQSEDGEDLPNGSPVEIVGTQGAVLIVRPL